MAIYTAESDYEALSPSDEEVYCDWLEAQYQDRELTAWRMDAHGWGDIDEDALWLELHPEEV